VFISINKNDKCAREKRKRRNIRENEIVKDLHRLTCTLQINLDKQGQQMNITGACFLFPLNK
jgi:hypothetical protein